MKQKIFHGDSYTRLYKLHYNIIMRCTSKKATGYYSSYGGRGIKLYQPWFDYITFKTWALSNGYTDELSIDRIDNNGNYEPSNCRWVNNSVQQSNRGLQKRNITGYIGVSVRTDRPVGYKMSIRFEDLYLSKRGLCKHTLARIREDFIIKHNLPNTRNF